MESGAGKYSLEPLPGVVVVRTIAHFTNDSRAEINRFTNEGVGSGLSRDQLDERQSRYSIRATLGPAFKTVLPYDSSLKDLDIKLVSLDGQKAILTGAIGPKDGTTAESSGPIAEFAFIAYPDTLEQDVDILVSDPGSMSLLIDELAIQL